MVINDVTPNIYTDHKKIKCSNLCTDVVYIKNKFHVVTDLKLKSVTTSFRSKLRRTTALKRETELEKQTYVQQ